MTNAIETHVYELQPDVHVKWERFPSIGKFGGFINVTMTFGEVRHFEPNHCPVAEYGIVEMNGSYYSTPGFGGQAIPGYELLGFKWLVGAVAGKSRTSVQSVRREYVQPNDVINYMLSLRQKVQGARKDSQDPTVSFGWWNSAKPGF